MLGLTIGSGYRNTEIGYPEGGQQLKQGIKSHAQDIAHADDAAGVTDRDRSIARFSLYAGLLVATIWWLRYGSNRWFIADDWSYLIYRDVFDQNSWAGARRALFMPMNGQPAVVSAVQFSLTGALFGWGSYLPFVAVNIGLHLVSALLLWRILLRLEVRATIASLVTLVVVFLGPATEFPTLAAISNYQFALVGFLAVVLLMLRSERHDTSWPRPVVVAAAIGVVASLASGFAVVFMFGEFVLGALLRRWRSTLIIVVPQLVIYALWFVTYGRGAPRGSAATALDQVPAWSVRVVLNTFDSLAAPSFGPLLAVLTLVFGVVTLTTKRSVRAVVLAMGSTMLAATLVIGTQRAGNGLANVAIGRYLVVLAFLAAPAVAVAIDRACRYNARLLIAFAVLAAVSVVVNADQWREGQIFMIDASARDRQSLEVLAGLDLSDYPPTERPSLCSPDITLGHLPELVERRAIAPIDATPEQLIVADQMLDPTSIVGADERPCAP